MRRVVCRPADPPSLLRRKVVVLLGDSGAAVADCDKGEGGGGGGAAIPVEAAEKEIQALAPECTVCVPQVDLRIIIDSDEPIVVDARARTVTALLLAR